MEESDEGKADEGDRRKHTINWREEEEASLKNKLAAATQRVAAARRVQ